jgi:hypothetical protein
MKNGKIPQRVGILEISKIPIFYVFLIPEWNIKKLQF